MPMLMRVTIGLSLMLLGTLPAAAADPELNAQTLEILKQVYEDMGYGPFPTKSPTPPSLLAEASKKSPTPPPPPAEADKKSSPPQGEADKKSSTPRDPEDRLGSKAHLKDAMQWEASKNLLKYAGVDLAQVPSQLMQSIKAGYDLYQAWSDADKRIEPDMDPAGQPSIPIHCISAGGSDEGPC